MCETASGLRVLFTAVCLRDQLAHRLSPLNGIDGSQGELSSLLVRSVSDLYKAGDALRTKSNISNSVCM